MKREIEFRGLPWWSDKWKYGSLVTAANTCVIIAQTNYPSVHRTPHTWDISAPAYAVNEDTVGQFTGLKDKNGVKIYEGDIIEFVLFDPYGNDTWYKGVVLFEESSFVVNAQHGSEEYLFSLWEVWNEEEGMYLEVIGNIHNKPELLEGDL